MNDADTLHLVAQAITDATDDTNHHPIHALIGAWFTSIAARGQGVADVDRDYAIALARTYLYGTP